VIRACVLACIGCAAHAAPSPSASKACASAEHRQLDFWIGDWDVEVRARQSPTSDTWGTGRGTQHVEAILGGCAIAEHFTADGPQQPWAGASYSSWQPTIGKWRQTWVDDSGGYLAFTGGLENGAMTLYGEPREQAGKHFQMRMVFLAVTPRSLRWEWQRSDEGGPYAPMMTITYRRAK
jgi:uncharacterized protein DUF1579